MKNILLLALLLIFPKIQAKPCDTINLVMEKEKLERMQSFDEVQVNQLMELKYKVKRAQIMSCFDQILGGQIVEFSVADRDYAKIILNDLDQSTQSYELKENIEFLFLSLDL